VLDTFGAVNSFHTGLVFLQLKSVDLKLSVDLIQTDVGKFVIRNEFDQEVSLICMVFCFLC
jgi:hypothetical protein